MLSLVLSSFQRLLVAVSVVECSHVSWYRKRVRKYKKLLGVYELVANFSVEECSCETSIFYHVAIFL